MYVSDHNKGIEKIYSRNKINFNKKGSFNNNNDKKKAFIKICIIVIIAIFIAKTIIDEINPILDRKCINKAKSIATIISNEQATIVMENYKYEDLAVVIKDSNENIKMIKLNIIPINEIASDVALKIQNELDNVKSSKFSIKFGCFTGIRILSYMGPNIKISMSTIGDVETNFRSEFKSTGINQTLHQIILDITCNVTIVTPYNCTTEKITNQIVLAESVIIGDIPNSYYNFNSKDDNAALEIIE